jgi:hypothetical protein
MKILTDVDGVLLLWNDNFHAWMKSKGYTLVHNESYDLSECYEISSDKAASLIEEFNSSAEMGFLSPMKDSVKRVREMHEEYGVVMHAISSMGSNPHAIKLREMNLHRLFGEHVFDRITILPCGASKIEALSEYKGSGLYWLEDHVNNANDGAALGLKSVLFNRSYNKPQKGIEENFFRVNSWSEFIRFLNFQTK